MSANTIRKISSKYNKVHNGVNDNQAKVILTHPNTDEKGNKLSLKNLILFHKDKTRQLIAKYPRDIKSHPELSNITIRSKLHRPTIKDVVSVETSNSSDVTECHSKGYVHQLNKKNLKMHIMKQSEKTRQLLAQKRN